MEKMTFPKLTLRDRMRLLGYANYQGYIFIYNVDKRKAILIKDGEILFIQKENERVFGINKNTGKVTNLRSAMRISYLLHEAGIFQLQLDKNTEIGRAHV